MRQRVLLVDGNNVIHAWPDLLALISSPGGRRSGHAHRELERRLTLYQDETGERVVLVFDGRGDTVEESDRRDGGIQIVRSAASNSADDIIGSLASRYGTLYELQVASDDRAVQDAVTAAGALSISTDGLLDAVERAERSMDGRLTRHHRRG